MLGEKLGSSSLESLTPGIILLWHIYLWHFKDIVEAMLSWRDRMVQGKRKHPSIWWPPRTSNICTWLHTNCRISKGRQCATLSSQPDLSKAWAEKPDPGPETTPCRMFSAEFLFCVQFQTYPSSLCWQSLCCVLPGYCFSWGILLLT